MDRNEIQGNRGKYSNTLDLQGHRTGNRCTQISDINFSRRSTSVSQRQLPRSENQGISGNLQQQFYVPAASTNLPSPEIKPSCFRLCVSISTLPPSLGASIAEMGQYLITGFARCSRHPGGRRITRYWGILIEIRCLKPVCLVRAPSLCGESAYLVLTLRQPGSVILCFTQQRTQCFFVEYPRVFRFKFTRYLCCIWLLASTLGWSLCLLPNIPTASNSAEARLRPSGQA